MELAALKREVRRAARGDGAAAAVLFDHYYPRLFRYALARARSRVDAEDIAAETFARVLREIGRFRWTGGGFEAWLFRIASNLIADRWRTAGREDVTDAVAEEVADPRDEPEHVALATETGEDLGAMIATLPKDQQEVLSLRFAADLSTHETARVMGRNANAVRQLQFRALTALRRQMGVDR